MSPFWQGFLSVFCFGVNLEDPEPPVRRIQRLTQEARDRATRWMTPEQCVRSAKRDLARVRLRERQRRKAWITFGD